MLGELRQVFPTIDATLTEADATLANAFKQPLSAYFAAVGDESQAERTARFEALSQTEVLQPALVACNEALRRTLVQFGAPIVAFGHSLGEISACIGAGVMSFEDGLRFAAERGRQLAQAGGGEGSMLQAAADADAIEKALGGWPEGITVANRNCTRQTVLGGCTAAVTAVQANLRRSGIDCSILPVSQAFHTPLMGSAVAPLRAHLQTLQLSPPRLALLSSVCGQSIPKSGNSQDWFADVLSRQVVQPVEFIETLRQAYTSGARLFVEVGPKQALSGFARDVLGTSEIDVIPCCSPKEGERRSFGRTLALLVASGVIPGHVRSQEELQNAPVIPRSAKVPAFVTPMPVDVQVAATSVSPPAAEAEVNGAMPTSSPGQLWQTLDQVADSPEFWQFLASQAQSVMKGAIATLRNGGPPLNSPANALPNGAAGGSPVGLVLPPVSANRSPVRGSLEWRLEWIARSLQYSVNELKLDSAMEDELGIDSDRQCDILRDLARALGRKAPALTPHQSFASLRSLFAALDALPQLEEPAAAEPTSFTTATDPVPVSSVVPLQRVAQRPTQVSPATEVETATVKPLQRANRGVSSPVGEQILTTLMARTGYTRAELQLDAHLEQVLGIDSIAQLEIIAELQDKLHLPMDETFRVANYPTLGKLIAYVEGKLAETSAPMPVPAGVTNTVSVVMKGLEAPFYCRQLAFEAVPPFTHRASRGRLVVFHDGSAPTLETRLGGTVVSFAGVSTNSLPEALSKNPDTLVVIASVPATLNGSPLNAASDATTKVFQIGQALLKVTKDPLPVVVIVGAQTDNPTGQAWKGAWVAAWKSLCREWSRRKVDFGYRDLRILELTGPIDAQVEPLITAVGHEGPLEARLDATGVWTYPVLRKVPVRMDSVVRDTPVAVITGGARGITAVIARALFDATACKLVLIGRTSPAEGAGPFDLVSERETVREALGPNATLPEINSTVEARRRAAEVAQTLRALREAGADPDYLTLDVAREGELAKALEFARSRYGRVDWVIHGAGRDSSSALLSKSAEDVLPVLQPKLAGLELSGGVTDKTAWIALSSVSARFGNAGQLEYAAANEAMARVVLAGGGLVLDFGPWRDTGMAATMVNLFKASGVDSLASREAAQAAVTLIVGGAKGEFVLAGRLGRSIGKLAGQNVALELDVPGAEYTVALTLEHERVAWLRDHTWRGAGLVPAVVSLAMMIDAAQGCEPSAPVTVVRSFHLDRPAIARPMRPLNLAIHAERPDNGNGNDAITVNACVQLAGQPIHGATIRLGAVPEPPGVHREDERLMPIRHSLSRQEFYRKAFHGASFQVLESVDIGDGWAFGESVPLGEQLGMDLPSHCRLTAIARELVLQTVGAYLGVTVGEVALPEAFAELRIHGVPEAGKRVRAKIQVRSVSDANPGFDVRLYSEDGRLIEVIEDLRFRRTGVALSLETVSIVSTKVA
jgi:malonyl CoA-acyl carrier protein transacylase